MSVKQQLEQIRALPFAMRVAIQVREMHCWSMVSVILNHVLPVVMSLATARTRSLFVV